MANATEQAERVRRLLAKASDALARMTPDQRAHHRHEQRVSFAAGNVAMSWPDTINGEPAIDVARRLVLQKAGPCPCGDCAHVREWRGSVERPGGARVLYQSGETVAGELGS